MSSELSSTDAALPAPPARRLGARVAAALRRPAGWCAHHAWWSAALALVLGVTGQILVGALGRGTDPASAGERLGGIVYTAAAWACVALVLAIATQPLMGSRIGRAFGVSLGALVLTALTLVLALGVALRLASGSYLTLGAIQFWLASGNRILDSGAGDYRGWLVLVLGISLALGVASALVLVRGARRSAARRRPFAGVGPVVTAAVLGAGVVVVFSLRNEAFARGMFSSTPMLVFVSSLEGSGGELERVRGGLGAGDELSPPPGPARSEETAWHDAVAASEGPRPNVLLVTLESVGIEHLGFAGYDRPTTPELDALAREGLWMRRAWTTATHSNYAQMAILSSLFPRRGSSLDQYERLDYPRFLFHDLFALLGYATATISSQDEQWQGMIDFERTPTPTHFWHSPDWKGPHLDIGSEVVVPDDKTTDGILAWLAEQRGRRWALYANFQATHFPYPLPDDAPRPWKPCEPDPSTFRYLSYPAADRQAAVNRYDNALAFVDAQLGRIRRYLATTGELGHTLFIVTADHGENFLDHEEVTHGKTLYESEARVPLVVSWPGHVPAAVRDEPVSHLDVLPTLVELLGLPPHPSFQGASFLRPGAVAGRGVYLNIQGLRFADALVCWPFKLFEDRTGKRSILFHLEDNPEE
ncbi:MAG: sulfatase, partial [Polyangiaceae bacterium]|nr:sulfatase [Polyangiaceae bacterium]